MPVETRRWSSHTGTAVIQFIIISHGNIRQEEPHAPVFLEVAATAAVCRISHEHHAPDLITLLLSICSVHQLTPSYISQSTPRVNNILLPKNRRIYKSLLCARPVSLFIQFVIKSFEIETRN